MDSTRSRSRRQTFASCCFVAPRVEEEHVVVQAEHPISDKPVNIIATTVTAHAKAITADSSAAYNMQSTEKAAALGRDSWRKAPDQNLIQHAAVPEMPNVKHLMAMSLNRPYTDDDWFAAMSALEKMQKVQQARALQQLRIHHPRLSHGSTFADDDTELWFDARSRTMSDSSVAFVSEAEQEEVAKLAHEIEEREHAQGQLTVSLVRELEPATPNCVPNPPLLFAEKHWKYCPVDTKPFCFYWERDPIRSTSFPLPIDEQLKLNALFQRTHQSIPGMWMREVGSQLLLHAQPTIMAMPGIVNYTEYYNKDQTPCSWALRRDIKIGKTMGQMYMTTDGLLIFRVFTSGMFSKAIEWVGEDYIRLEDNGETIVTRQLCKMNSDGSVGCQFLVGRKVGLCPPKRSSISH